jgi:hypothetical protein
MLFSSLQNKFNKKVVICSSLFFTFKNIFEFILSHCKKERHGNQELILLSVSIFLSAEKAEQKGFSLLSGLKTPRL